uniref:Uncharacterized protein n=1 Tax=Solanum tuberosum TaxID=4113 RepID=M1DYM4_SOLTU
MKNIQARSSQVSNLPSFLGFVIKDMSTTRENARRNDEDMVDQEVPTQAPQAPIDPLGKNVTNAEFRSAFQVWLKS